MSQQDELSQIWFNGIQLRKSDGFFKPIAEELEERSITPTTFKSMHLYDSNLCYKVLKERMLVKAKKNEIEARKEKFIRDYKDFLSKLKEHVKGVAKESEFGQSENCFTTLVQKFAPKISQFEKYLIELERFQIFVSKIASLPLSFVEKYQVDGHHIEVERFGINTPHLKGQIGEDLAIIYASTTEKASPISISTQGTKKTIDSYPHLLHPLEVFLIRNAIKHCTNNRNKVVLVDIFERKEDGSINILKAGTPKTHTIVFCFQNSKILLIDPSNSEFSRHLTF